MKYIIIYFKIDGYAYPHIDSTGALIIFEKYKKANKEYSKLEREQEQKKSEIRIFQIITLEIAKNPLNL